MAHPTFDELKEVADSIKACSDFGYDLSLQINTYIHGISPRPGDRASWPSKPPLPIPLEYTSDPRPIQGG
jgi:hypothetical protein